MAPSYPHQALPYPTFSWSHRPEIGRVVVEAEDGTVTQYRKTTKPARTATASWDMDKAKFRLFRSFLMRDLNYATEWFTIVVNFTSGGFERCRARFVAGEFAFAHVGPDRFSVSGQLDIVAAPQPEVSVDDITNLMDSTTDFTFDQA